MIIINIEMPEKCGMCPLFRAENPMYCNLVKADKTKRINAPYGLPRPEWCPLVEVKTEKEQQPLSSMKRMEI